MSIANIKIITSEDEDEIKKIFEEELLNYELEIEGYKLKIFPEDFQHICYDYSEDGNYKGKFCLRRARKMLVIKHLCEGIIPYVKIFQKDRSNQSTIILCEPLEFAMYIVPQPSEKGLFFRLGTIISFGKNVESRMEKEKLKGDIYNSLQDIVSILNLEAD